jgi:hypothetical protein
MGMLYLDGLISVFSLFSKTSHFIKKTSGLDNKTNSLELACFPDRCVYAFGSAYGFLTFQDP